MVHMLIKHIVPLRGTQLAEGKRCLIIKFFFAQLLGPVDITYKAVFLRIKLFFSSYQESRPRP